MWVVSKDAAQHVNELGYHVTFEVRLCPGAWSTEVPVDAPNHFDETNLHLDELLIMSIPADPARTGHWTALGQSQRPQRRFPDGKNMRKSAYALAVHRNLLSLS